MTRSISATPTAAAAPILDASEAVLDFPQRRKLRCVYVQVDPRGRPDVSAFLTSWRRCCDAVSVDWQSLRRPAAALVGVELRHCCGDTPSSLRLVFDVRRDRDALDALARTQTVVVGNRPYGGFANSMAAYGLEGKLVTAAVKAAESGLRGLVSVAS